MKMNENKINYITNKYKYIHYKIFKITSISFNIIYECLK